MPYPYGFNQGYQYPYQNPYQPGQFMPQAQPIQQPQQPVQQPQMMPQAAQMQGGIIWVQGDAGAKSYIVAPGNTVPLWDSEAQTIYIKSVDVSGMPSMRVIDYTERTGQTQATKAPETDFITRKEFEETIASLRPQRKKKEEKEDDA